MAVEKKSLINKKILCVGRILLDWQQQITMNLLMSTEMKSARWGWVKECKAYNLACMKNNNNIFY